MTTSSFVGGRSDGGILDSSVKNGGKLCFGKVLCFGAGHFAAISACLTSQSSKLPISLNVSLFSSDPKLACFLFKPVERK